jgi:hypothetical protein
MEKGIDPPPPRAPRPPPTGNLVYLQLSTRMDLDSVADNREQPNLESAAIGQCMDILFFFSHLVTLSFGTPPKGFICIVLIVVIFFRFD